MRVGAARRRLNVGLMGSTVMRSTLRASLVAGSLLAGALPVAIGVPGVARAQTGGLPPQPPVTATPLTPAPQYAPPSYPTQAPGSAAPDQSGASSQPPSQPPPAGTPAPRPPLPGGPSAPGAPPPGTSPLGGAPPSAGPGAFTPAPPRPNVWVPQGTAVLQALDKVNAQSATLTVKVGQSAKFGSLTIAVQSCQIRPPDQPADATAFLTITDAHADAPGFKGWMLKSDPAVSMLEHPLYDVRVIGCAP